MHGPFCTFWANLTPFSLKGKAVFETECDTKMSELVTGAPPYIMRSLLGQMCPCQCKLWAPPPICEADAADAAADTAAVANWQRYRGAKQAGTLPSVGPVPVPPEGLGGARPQARKVAP
jgi:hypothetical protein